MKVVKALFYSFLIFQVSNTLACCGGSYSYMNELKDRLYSFTFVKSYRLDAGHTEITSKYTIVLSEGTKYKLSVLIELTEENPLYSASVSIDQYNHTDKSTTPFKEFVLNRDNQWDDAIEFQCNATGIYYLTFTLPKNACGAAALGFKRDKITQPHQWNISIVSPEAKTASGPQAWRFNLTENEYGKIQLKIRYRDEDWYYGRTVHKITVENIEDEIKMKLLKQFGIKFKVNVEKLP